MHTLWHLSLCLVKSGIFDFVTSDFHLCDIRLSMFWHLIFKIVILFFNFATSNQFIDNFVTSNLQQSDLWPLPHDPVLQLKPADFKRAVKVALFNQTVVGIPYLYFNYVMMTWRGCPTSPDDLPTLGQTLVHLIAFVLLEEIGFYYSHRYTVTLCLWGV